MMNDQWSLQRVRDEDRLHLHVLILSMLSLRPAKFCFIFNFNYAFWLIQFCFFCLFLFCLFLGPGTANFTFLVKIFFKFAFFRGKIKLSVVIWVLFVSIVL